MPSVNLQSCSISDGDALRITRVYVVEYTESEVANVNRNPVTLGKSARVATGIPAKGSFDGNAKLVTKNASMYNESYNTWIVTCEFTSSEAEQRQAAADPLNDPSKLDYSFIPLSIELEKDVNGTPIQNTAKDWLDPPITSDVKLRQIVITKNIPSGSLATFDALADKFNSSSVTISGRNYAAKSLLFDDLRASTESYIDGNDVRQYYIAMSIVLTVADGVWVPDWEQVKRYSVGYRQLVTGAKQPILDTTGSTLAAPWPLNEDGTKKANATDTPFLMSFTIRTGADFSPIESLLS